MAIAIIVCARWFFHSELSTAVAETLRAKHGGQVDPLAAERLEELADRIEEELGEVRGEVAELAERVDFTERVLLEVRGRTELPEGRQSS
jgi:hypothetical protein